MTMMAHVIVPPPFGPSLSGPWPNFNQACFCCVLAKEGPDFHQYALDASLVDKANDTNGRERHDSTSNSGDDRSWEKRRPGG